MDIKIDNNLNSDEEEEDVTNSGMSNEEEFPEFFFETDHLALKGNDDYLNMLKTLAILEAQKVQGIKDIDSILQIQEEILKDPILFVKKLQKGEEFNVPPSQNIPEVPEIDWNKYGRPPPEHLKANSSSAENDNSKILIRGRKFDESKPETFNQLWTSEEQRRLEELLIDFPPEEIETKRWQKIATALGNRTPKQVCSRVQKYFIKLQKAGLPIPGRAPRSQPSDLVKRKAFWHKKYNNLLYKPTTFFPSRDIPVSMSDFDDRNLIMKEDSFSEEIEDPKDLIEFQLDLLRRVQNDKENPNSFKHSGFQCESCNETINGTRWHCMDCFIKSVDFCSDCVLTQLESDNPHPIKHYLNTIRNEESPNDDTTICDKDYLPFSFSDQQNSMYNYLDTNFMPG